MLLLRGCLRGVGLEECDGRLGGVRQLLAAVRDRAAASVQEHGPSTSGAAGLASDRRCADFAARLADSLYGSHSHGPYALSLIHI